MRVRILALLLLAFVPADAQPDEARWRALLRTDAAGDPEPRAREALKIAERFGEADPRLLESLIYLGEVLDESEAAEEQKKLLDRALRLRQRVANQTAGDRAGAIHFAGLLVRLGRQASERGEHRESRLTLRESLELREKLFGEQSAEAAEVWVALAWTAWRDSKPQEARSTMDRALEIREQAGAGRSANFAARSLEYAGLLEESARLYEVTKKPVAAEQEYLRAVAVREMIATPGDERLAEALTRIARKTRWSLRTVAEKCYRRAVAVRAAAGKGSAAHREALNDLAQFLGDTERPREAEAIYRSAISLGGAKVADDAAVVSFLRLLSVRREDGRYREAVEAGEQALAAAQSIGSAQTFRVREQLAEVCLLAGEDARAEELFGNLRESATGPARYLVAVSADRLSEIYQERGDYPKAAEKLEVALAAAEATGAPDGNQLDRMLRLSKLYQAMGRTEDANRMNIAMIGQTGRIMGAEAQTNPRLRQALLAGAAVLAGAFFFGIAVCGILFRVMARQLNRKLLDLFGPPAVAAAGVAELVPVRFLVPEEATPPALEEQAPVPPDTEPSAAPPPPPTRMTVHADGTTLFAMRVLNLLLALLTLGVYSFWGKAKVRRYVFGQIEYLGDRFAFHGHGRELFLGWLRALPALAFVFLFPNILPLAWQSKYSMLVAQLAVFALIFVLWPIARVGAYRYRITRMSWRGIRFSYRGSALRYLGVTAAGYLCNSLTGGLYNPFLDMRRERLLTGDTYFGTARFQFTGKGSDLFAAWLFALPFTFCTLGLAWPWWSALRQRYVWAHTTAPGVRFRSTATGWGLLRLWSGNFALIVFTLGLGASWAMLRTLDFWSRHIEVTGAPELDAVRQDLQAVSAQAESYADFLGFDFGL